MVNWRQYKVLITGELPVYIEASIGHISRAMNFISDSNIVGKVEHISSSSEISFKRGNISSLEIKSDTLGGAVSAIHKMKLPYPVKLLL